MGNVPISCCRSKSPRPDNESLSCGSGNRNGLNARQSSSNSREPRRKPSNKSGPGDEAQHADLSSNIQTSHILQHISEREPDDSETDPSSNPLNRPIFAARSTSSKSRSFGTNYTDSYSSNNSSSIRKQVNTPLTSSQDHGYNSSISTNFTHYDGQLINSSFDSNSIQTRGNQQQVSTYSQPSDGLNELTGKVGLSDNNLLQLSTPTNSEDTNQYSPLESSNKCFSIHDEQTKQGNDQCQKASSCSTIYIDESTISQPNLDQTIKCVSLAIYYHIKNRTSDNSAEIFDESIHPLKMPISPSDIKTGSELISLDPDQKSQDEPDQKVIYNFVKTLFKSAQLTSEYAITTLVYLERLMTYAEMDLTPKTWRRMFLGAILLSSKVWEDQAVWNVDYAQILEEISVEDINELERQFLELIQFNMNVPSSVYAKYYFHLRTLALKNGLSNGQSILRVGKARELEAMSRIYTTDLQSSPIHRKSPPTIKRHTSLEKLRLHGQARAILM